ATIPVSRQTRNASDDRVGSIASNRHVMPTMMFDWIVKKTKTFSVRAVEVLKNPVLRDAVTKSWITMPAMAASAVSPNHMRSFDIRTRGAYGIVRGRSIVVRGRRPRG